MAAHAHRHRRVQIRAQANTKQFKQAMDNMHIPYPSINLSTALICRADERRVAFPVRVIHILIGEFVQNLLGEVV